MKILVIPGADGVISDAGQILGQPLPDTAVVIDVTSLELPPATAARINTSGELEIVANWRGSGPWYDQGAALADRETPIHITELGLDPREQPWAMTPRPLTKAEIAAQTKAEAEAKAAAEAEAKAARTILPEQLQVIVILQQIKPKITEALEKAGKTAVEIEAAVAMIDYRTRPIRYDDATLARCAALLGWDKAAYDAFWAACEAVPV